MIGKVEFSESADTIPSSAQRGFSAFFGCGPAQGPLSTANKRKIRFVAVLMMIASLIEFGVGGAANHLFRHTVGLSYFGCWWGSLFSLIAGLVAAVFCTAERRLWITFVLSNIASLVALVGSIQEGIGSSTINSIQTVASVQNVTALNLYSSRGNSWQGQSSKIQNSAVRFWGNPTFKQAAFGCISALPKDNMASMGMNDDAIASCSTGSTTQADYIACVTLANAYKFQPNVCYFYTSYLTAQCGRGDLQFQEGAVGASVPSPSSPSPPSLYPRPAPLTRYTKPSLPPYKTSRAARRFFPIFPI